jgi:hypothetical protein
MWKLIKSTQTELLMWFGEDVFHAWEKDGDYAGTLDLLVSVDSGRCSYDSYTTDGHNSFEEVKLALIKRILHSFSDTWLDIPFYCVTSLKDLILPVEPQQTDKELEAWLAHEIEEDSFGFFLEMYMQSPELFFGMLGKNSIREFFNLSNSTSEAYRDGCRDWLKDNPQPQEQEDS